MSDDSNLEISQGSTHAVETPRLSDAPAFELSAAVSSPVVSSGAPDEDKTVISAPEGASPAPAIRAGSPQEIAALLLGQSLGHFNLDQFVGGGGMGAVFRAHDQQLDRTVAIKVLSKGHGEEEVVKRFRIEAQSAARLDHENIARVFYVGEDRGWDYIVFEFIDGANLRDVVYQKGPLSLEEAMQYSLQIAAALEHASERDVVHRDIKPSNVLVTATGQVKLVDMGLARVHTPQREGDLTESGVTLGTFDYISPEQARDPRNADVRSDLYSLGCTLYFIVTGQPPFPDGNFFQKLLKHQNERHADPRLLRPDLDEDFVAVLDKLLAKQPSRRYQTPAELISALVAVAENLGIDVSSPRIAATVRSLPKASKWKPHLAWMIPLALMVMGIWGVDAYLRRNTASGWPPPPPEFASVKISLAEVGDPKSASVSAEPKSIDIRKANAIPYQWRVPESSRSGALVGSDGSRFADLSKAGSVSVSPWKGSSSAGQVSPHAGRSPLPVDLIVVTDEPELLTLGPKQGYFSSLQEALLAVAERSSIRTIEITATRLRVDSPLLIQASQLNIRSEAGAVLQFPAPADPFSTRHAAIVQMGGVVRWEGIQFDWVLPRDMARASTLLELRDIQRTTFTGCVLTAHSGERGVLAQESPSFLRVETTVEGGMLNPELMLSNPVDTVIDLTDCMVRGDAGLLSASPSANLSLRWTDGLFASAKRLAEFRGAHRRPVANTKASIELTRVTLQSLAGLSRTSTTVDEPYAVPTHLNLRDSFISIPPETPIVETYRQDANRSADTILLVVDGEGNTYFGATVLWAMTSGAGKVDTVFKIKDLVMPWYRESTPGLGPSLLMPQLGALIPTETATPDLFLSGAESFRRGGFTPERLPLPIEE